MAKRMKFEHINMKNGVEAVLSTVEIAPSVYETLLSSSDFETEYVKLCTTSEAQALLDFKHLKKQYHIEPLKGRYAKLAKELEAAAAYGLEAATAVDGDGTCNLDAVLLNLKGWGSSKVEEVAKIADVGFREARLRGYYILSLHCSYQANARTVAAKAMCEALQLAGYDASIHYQIA